MEQQLKQNNNKVNEQNAQTQNLYFFWRNVEHYPGPAQYFIHNVKQLIQIYESCQTKRKENKQVKKWITEKTGGGKVIGNNQMWLK